MAAVSAAAVSVAAVSAAAVLEAAVSKAAVSKAAVSAVSAAAVGGGVGYHRVLAADKAVGEEKGENAAHAYCMALEEEFVVAQRVVMAAAAAAAAAAVDGGDGGGGSGRSGSHVTQVGRRTNPSRSRMIYFAHVSGHGYLRPRNVSREPDVRVEAVRICGETRAVLADFNEKAPFVDGCAASAVTRQALPDCQCCLRRAPESRHVQLRGDTERCSDSFGVTDRRHRQAKVADTGDRKARRCR